ncbi:MAG: response regulator transcription factor [Vescimonas sp.]
MYRILVCDGEKEIVSSLTACLTAEGYQVVTARTGWEVLNILSKQHIHLALLGTKLPGLDGLTTVTRLRQMHDLPVILLTSGTDSTENILGLTIGADDYITKPFQQAELLVRIRCHLLRCVFTSKNRLFSLLKNAKCKKEAKYEIKRIFGRNHSFTLVRYKGAMNILRMHLNF